MLWKCYIQYASKYGKVSSGHRTGKGQFSSQSQRQEMPNNVQPTTQLHSFHMLTSSVQSLSCVQLFAIPWIANKVLLKILQTRLQQYVNWEIPEKAEEPEIKLPTSTGLQKKQENSRKTSIAASLTSLKPLTMWITANCGKFSKRWEYQTTLPAPEKPVCRLRSNS